MMNSLECQLLWQSVCLSILLWPTVEHCSFDAFRQCFWPILACIVSLSYHFDKEIYHFIDFPFSHSQYNRMTSSNIDISLLWAKIFLDGTTAADVKYCKQNTTEVLTKTLHIISLAYLVNAQFKCAEALAIISVKTRFKLICMFGPNVIYCMETFIAIGRHLLRASFFRIRVYCLNSVKY